MFVDANKTQPFLRNPSFTQCKNHMKCGTVRDVSKWRIVTELSGTTSHFAKIESKLKLKVGFNKTIWIYTVHWKNTHTCTHSPRTRDFVYDSNYHYVLDKLPILTSEVWKVIAAF